MEKVKLTQEQIEVVRRFMNNNYVLKLSVNELHKVIDGFYELKETFDVGEWVVCEDGYIGEIEFINEVEKWANIGYSKDTRERGVCLATTYDLIDIIRYATPEEIAEEKQRRWWAKHGRDVFEFKTGDLIVHGKIVSEVTKVRGDLLWVEMNAAAGTITKENYDQIKVICFAEDRKDMEV